LGIVLSTLYRNLNEFRLEGGAPDLTVDDVTKIEEAIRKAG
jgi:hypothetical protein